jgi:hypothetical protein
MKLDTILQLSEKHSNFRFHEYLPIGSRVVPYERTDGRKDAQTDMTKLIFSFPNFAKGPEIACISTKGEETVGWGGGVWK